MLRTQQGITLFLSMFFVFLLLPLHGVQASTPGACVGTAETTAPLTENNQEVKSSPLPGFFELKAGNLTYMFFIRLLIDMLSALVLVRLIYFRIYRNSEFFFTFLVFNLLIFLITYLLNKVEMSLGAAFGLFAVFSMLRYRTEGISAREMTYLFVLISVGLITAVSTGTVFELLIMDAILILFIFLLESDLFIRKEFVQTIQYDLIENIRPENKDVLLADLKARTGLPIHRITVGNIDFVKDSTQIKVHYYQRKSKDLKPETFRNKLDI